MATIIQTDSAITAVLPNTPLAIALGDIFISDLFNRAGALGGSLTDSYAGGTPTAWEGTALAANVTQTDNGGQLRLAGAGVFSQCVNAGRPDATMTMKLVSDTANRAGGQNSMIEFRKALSTTGDTYRITLGAANATTRSTLCQVYRRVGGAAVAMGAVFGWAWGATLKIDIKGSVINIYSNDVLLMTLTDANVPAGNFFGFAGSSSNVPFVITEFKLRSN